MTIKLFQKGFSYAQDGTGNRLVYHLQGCNMSCPWCANPEGMALCGAMLVDEAWLFDELCARGAIRDQTIDRSICDCCEEKTCITAHRSRAIRLSCHEADVSEMLEEALRSRPMFFDGGGVTFTGGEPTLQFEPLKDLLGQLQAHGISTAMESNASHPRCTELLPLLDEVILDVKQCEEQRHQKAVGISNRCIQENVKTAILEHQQVHIRIPLIHGVNDSKEDLANFLAFFTPLKTEHTTFELLPYHEYGKVKWAQCGLPYRMVDAFLPAGTQQEFEAHFIRAGLRIRHT